MALSPKRIGAAKTQAGLLFFIVINIHAWVEEDA